MSDVHQEGSGSGDAFDLTQFYQIFFEEAGENLDQMEQMLLNLNLEDADDEQLNGIFRCAHSIKGGAATFGFSDVAALTHQMESLLDRLRRHELKPHAMMVDVLLEAVGVLGQLPRRFVIQADNTAKETKNTITLSAAAWLMAQLQHTRLEQIEFCYLVVGHTHDLIDATFAFVSKAVWT